MRRIKVLVVDDHTIVRDGICAVLALAGDIEVIGEASNGSEALKMVKELEPDVVLMDIAMPIMDGLEATRRIHKELPRSPFMMEKRNSPYCTRIGRSRPSSVRRAVSDSWEAESPRMTWAGSPGAMRTTKKTRVTTAIKMGMASSSRLMMYCSIPISSPRNPTVPNLFLLPSLFISG